MLKLLNFNIIIQQASGRYNALSETKQKELKESLSNGKALLDSGYTIDCNPQICISHKIQLYLY